MGNHLYARRDERLLQRPGDRPADEHIHGETPHTFGPSQNAHLAQRFGTSRVLDFSFHI
jgi:hypothetical protein